MINLVSTTPHDPGWGGAAKVYRNVVGGLDAIGASYVVNRDHRATDRLWIHNDVFALPLLKRTHAHAIVGPNLFVMPGDIPRMITFDAAVYVQPSEWVVQLWREVGFDACELAVWPVGVDTVRFAARPAEHADRALVYFKRRPTADLDVVVRALEHSSVAHDIVRFGAYTEAEYMAALRRTSFVVWVGCPESQGLALEEALSCDVPVLVWDATRLEQANSDAYTFDRRLVDFPVTSAPYFDDSCGVRITRGSELETAVERMRSDWRAFRPRAFIERTLSLEGQARALLRLWEGRGAEGDTTVARSAEPLRYSVVEALMLRWQRRFGPRLALRSPSTGADPRHGGSTSPS